jgi:hypothetical protein
MPELTPEPDSTGGGKKNINIYIKNHKKSN